ncbi:hypothetical protein L6Q79_11135 [bacterium]|nr:hypothetical protein [bacterium]NUN46238.1 hypothetical protein [bacterium]
MRYTAILALMILVNLAPPAAYPGGSSYSATTYGLYEYKPNPRSLGMGGAGLAIPSYYTLNMQNPATLLGIPMTRFELNMFAEWNQASNGAAKNFSNRATINHVAFAFPFGKTLVAAINLSRVTNVNYEFSTPNLIFEGEKYTETLIGTGGLQQLAFTGAGKINPKWTIGASLQYLFGTIKREWGINYNSDELVDTRDVRHQNMSGGRLVIGGLYQHNEQWNFGGFLSMAGKISSDVRVVGTYRDTTVSYEQSLNYPTEIGFGASYRWTKRYLLATDIVYGTWGSVKEFSPTQKNRNTVRWSGGVERQPSNAFSAPWWDKNYYRFGLMINNLYATNTTGNHASEIMFTLGIGMPFNRERSSFDLSLEAGQRGQIADNKVRDRVYRLTLSFTGGERWFLNRQKRKRD